MQSHCPSCGTETFPGARFCRRCGAPVRDAGVQETGDVSPLAATVPLREEGQGRKTDGLAPGEERASAETSRVSRADVERLLRSQQDDGGRNGLDPAATIAQFGRDTLAEVRARDDGAAARDPEATLAAHPAVTRPDAPAAFEHGEELTVTVPRPVLPTETHEVTADSFAAQDALSTMLQGTTRDAPPFEPGANVDATRESAPLAPPSTDGHAVAQTPGVQSPAAPRRRRWPFVVAACAAALLFTVAAAWLAVRFLRRPPVTETASQAPTTPAVVAPDVQQQFDEKLAQAEALLAQGNMNEAVARLREANALDPSNARAHRRLGELLLASGARREAVEEFRAVTRNAPEDFTAWRQLATAQFAEGLYRDAAESYRRLVALVGDSAEPSDLLSYADALRLSGRTDEARTLYQRLTSAPSSDVSDAARQRLAELARAQPTPGAVQRPGEQVAAQPPREGETTSSMSPAGPSQPAETQPVPAPQPTPTPQPARPAAATPAEHYRHGVELWSSNRAAALEEFRAAATGGSADAHYYLGLGYVEGRSIHALKRAEVVAALQHFQMAQRGGEHAAEARRYEQELERVFDRLRKQ